VKRIYVAAIVAASLSLPLLSHAQSTGTHITRAQVRAELIAAEKAGQYPQSYSHYPDASPDAALEYVANRAEFFWGWPIRIGIPSFSRKFGSARTTG
jgi:hypothetical protein